MLGQLASSPEITVSHPGKAKIFVRESAARPASVAPARMKTKKFETQAVGVDITFKCYGAEVTASVGDSKYCGEL